MCTSFVSEDLNVSTVMSCHGRTPGEKNVCIIFEYFRKGTTSGMFTYSLVKKRGDEKKIKKCKVFKCKILLVFSCFADHSSYF